MAAIPVVLLASIGILKLTDKAKIYGDTAIGIVSSLGIAIGVMLASKAGGFNVDLFSYLFGNILSISMTELVLAAVLFLLVVISIVLFYNELFATTFDEDLANSAGIRTSRINMILVLLTALTVVLAMKVVGIMLISALLILPAVSALQFARSFKAAILSSALIGMCTVTISICLSLAINIPAGATIVLLNFLVFAVCFCFRFFHQR